MKTFNKQLIENFFKGTCTPDEAEQVLDWLETSEGQDYLDERLGKEIEEWDEEEVTPGNHSSKSSKNEKTRFGATLDSDMLFQRIIDKLEWYRNPRRRSFLNPLFQIAAVLCVISFASLFYVYSEHGALTGESEAPIVFSTIEDQQKKITLRDGSVVHLNSHSELILAGDFNKENRSVTLTGEAFFDVVHKPNKPFIIRAGASEIEVLGTSFNVKHTDTKTNVSVAVTEGKVRLAHADRERFSRFVVLEKGHYGDLNTMSGQILSDDNGVENYLTWRHGRLEFEFMSMEEVCVQLGRIYGVNCSFDDPKIKNRTLTANFSSEGLEKSLSVIGNSLNLRYEKEAELIHWFNN